jgi:hypothetical protein
MYDESDPTDLGTLGFRRWGGHRLLAGIVAGGADVWRRGEPTRLRGRRGGGVGVLGVAERPGVHGVGGVIDPRQLTALASTVVAHDDETELRRLPHVPRRAAMGPRVIAGN